MTLLGQEDDLMPVTAETPRIRRCRSFQMTPNIFSDDLVTASLVLHQQGGGGFGPVVASGRTICACSAITSCVVPADAP